MTIALISFFGFMIMVAVVSYYMTRNEDLSTSDGYFLGGRSLTMWTIAGSLMMTNLSTEHLIGMNGDAFNHTIAIMAWEVTSAIAMVLLAVYFLPMYLKNGLTTIPEFFSKRFDGTTRVIATFLFLASYVVAILPVVLLFGANGLEGLFDVSENLGVSQNTSIWLLVVGIGVVGSIYAVAGGLKAVAISDTINGVGFLIVGLLIPIIALSQIGDGNPIEGFGVLYEAEKPKFDITGDEPGSFLPFGVLFTGMIVNQLFFWCANQSILQRTLAATSLKEGQKGVLLAAGFKLLGPFLIVLPGIIAYHLYKESISPDQYLLAYPTLVKNMLPAAMIGFFASVMVGAVFSTFNSVLNSSATLFSHGVYKTLLKKDATDRQLVTSGRICSVVLAIIAIIAAANIDSTGSLFNYIQVVNAMFFGPMLAVLLLGALTKHVSAIAAKVGLIGGPLIFALLVFVFGDPVQAFLKELFNTQDDIHFLHFLAFVFVITAIAMFVISHFCPAKTIFEGKHTGEVDITPWPYVKPVGVVICIITICMFLVLAQ